MVLSFKVKEMRGPRLSSAMSLVLSFFLLLSDVGLAKGTGQESCLPSCGQLNIRYPFRLKGDPAWCGDPNFELVCDSNKTILYLRSGEYFVTSISYRNQSIQLVDVGLANGSCHLPKGSLTYHFPTAQPTAVDTFLEDVSYIYWPSFWASFVNCTQKISDPTYTLVPCLSQNDSFAYVRSEADVPSVIELQDSCHFLAMIPIADAIVDSHTDIFDLLEKGFSLSWVSDVDVGGGLSKSRRTRRQIRHCLREASSMFTYDVKDAKIFSGVFELFRSEKHFVSCLAHHMNPYAIYDIAMGLVILICIVEVLIILLILGRFLFAPLTVCGFLAYKFWRTMVPLDDVEKFLQNQQALMPTRYAYTDIIAMTSHFKQKLGQGGFGSVFRGSLPGDHLVAVKMLRNSKCNGEEFISEVSTIGRIHHVNVVKLIGFCSDGSNRALVYEYMPNGSLDRYIFSSNGTNHHFTVEKLNEIALGVARGIDYLHRGCDMQILHFDIKPHNILLDHAFTPKISDFGLAKLYPKDYSLVSLSAARGTIGYIAPELISRNFGVVSHKSDVYSFGMLLLEMAGGRRNVDPRVERSSEVYYPSWIYDKLNQSEGFDIGETFEIDKLERKLCMVGLWCIQMRSSNRPSMSKVIEMLEANVDTLQMPPKPFFCSPQKVSINQSCSEASPAELSVISEDD